MGRHVFAIVIVASLAVVVPGTIAGAGSDRPTPKQWAKGVCSSIEDWITSIQDTVSSLSDADSIEDAVDTASTSIQDATNQLGSDLGDLGVPQTKDAKKADQALTKLDKQLEKDVQSIEDSLADPGSGAVEIAATFADIGTTIQKAINQVRSAGESLSGLNRSGELQKALKSSPACKSLKNAV